MVSDNEMYDAGTFFLPFRETRKTETKGCMYVSANLKENGMIFFFKCHKGKPPVNSSS